MILSDLWGKEKSAWLTGYTQILKSSFEITYYDCCQLGGVSQSDYTEEKLHQQFVDGGIERAVEKLIELERGRVVILAFSIGGTIAWRYGIRSGTANALVCVSSTRLRYETVKPNGPIVLYFGSQDPFKPDSEWLVRMGVEFEVLANSGHQCYRESKVATRVSKRIAEE